MQSRHPSKPPRLRSRRFGPGLVLEGDGPVPLAGGLEVLLRAALVRTSSIAECAALCGVTVAELRRVSRMTRVPLLFAVALDEEGGHS